MDNCAVITVLFYCQSLELEESIGSVSIDSLRHP